MRFGRPSLWIGLCSMLVVLLTAVVDSDRAAPGPLSAVHGRVPELAQNNSCAQCHGGWFSTMTEGCMKCHETIRQDVETSHGLHGTLDANEVMACARCHSEHHGPTFSMVNARSFANGGVGNAEDFDHVLVGFAMNGAHDELSCNECHEHADVDVLDEGAFRFGGLAQSCDTCHEYEHEERLSNNCAECHDQIDFARPSPAAHASRLPLVGGHAALSCRDCHDLEGSHRLGLRATAERSCSDCHETPHAPQFGQSRLSAQALSEQPLSASPGNECLACHAAEHETFTAAREELSAEQHAGSGFPLQAPHDTVDCESCHGEDSSSYAERFAARDRNACQQCHDDPHEGQFDESNPEEFAALDQPCMSCHRQSGFEPTLFDSARHQGTEFPLSGQHLEAECAACHLTPDDGAVRRFAETSPRCDSCHDDAHQGAFEAGGAALTASQQLSDCSQCHDSAGFARAAHDGFEHELWTGFPLRGAHSQVDCESCHPRSAAADEQGRRFGRIADLVDSPRACASCHGDPHQGHYSDAAAPADIDGRKGCLRCHTASSFRTLQDDYDHGLWTGFALVGHHAQADCSSCHQARPTAAAPNSAHADWGTAKGDSCVACHDSPHAGQFGTGATASCERCHAGANGFDDLSFDHDRDSRFALTETHAALSCDACHEALSAGPLEIVRYRPLPRDCVDCHGVHEDVLLLRRELSR